MWLQQCHEPSIWDWFIAPIKIVMTGGWFIIVFPTWINNMSHGEYSIHLHDEMLLLQSNFITLCVDIYIWCLVNGGIWRLFFLLEQLIAGEGVPLLWCKNQALIRSLVELKKLAEPGFRRMSSALITRSILDGYFNHLVFWYQWDYLWLFRSMAISGTDSLQAPTIYI